jgi:hypothetical protein
MGPICCPDKAVTNYHSYSAQKPKREKASTKPRQKPDISHLLMQAKKNCPHTQVIETVKTKRAMHK